MLSRITRYTRNCIRFKFAVRIKDFNSAFFQFLKSSNLSYSRTKLLNSRVGIIWYTLRTRGNSFLSISFRYFLPYRATWDTGKDCATTSVCIVAMQSFSLTSAISLCRVVGNVDACGHFARNVSSDAPRDIRRQKRGTSPTSIIMCVTYSEGKETSFHTYKHYPTRLVPWKPYLSTVE